MRMALIQRHELLELLAERLGECKAIDIAVAWVAPCPARPATSTLSPLRSQSPSAAKSW